MSPGSGRRGLLLFAVGQSPVRADQGAQAGVQGEAPRIRADVKALELRDQPDVGEADFGLAALRGEFEADLGVPSFGLVLGEVEVAV